MRASSLRSLTALTALATLLAGCPATGDDDDAGFRDAGRDSGRDTGRDTASDGAPRDTIEPEDVPVLNDTGTDTTPVDAGGDAQVTGSPVADGTIAPGEYGDHTDGRNQQTSGTGSVWYMRWDDSNLYVAIAPSNADEGMVLYVDADPDAMNGAPAGQPYDSTRAAMLPFRADFVLYLKRGYHETRRPDATGAWQEPMANMLMPFLTDTVREVAIPWSAITSSGRPAAFAWSGYVTSGSGFVYAQMPGSNPMGMVGTDADFAHAYRVSDTSTASTTFPFDTVVMR